MWEAIAFSLLVGGIQLRNSLQYSRKRLETWQSAASSCGLRVDEISSLLTWRLKLAARERSLEVRIEECHAKEHPTRVVVAGPPGFSGVRIRRELDQPPGAREIEVGDPSFDRTFSLEGPLRLVGLLDAVTRRLLVRVNARCRLEIVGGELRAEMTDAALPDLLPLLVDISRRFAQPVDVTQRLAENAHRDPEAGVRLQNLLLLVREFPESPMTVEDLRTACSDPSPQVRLQAAMTLGDEGRTVLVELAERLEDDACSAKAISRLGRELELGRTKAILTYALRRRRIRAAHACLEALGRSREAAAVDMLAKVTAREKGELAAAAAVALGATRSAAAEPPLILALRHENPDVRVAAATALGRIASAAAVLPLKEAAKRYSDEPELRRATRQAIAEIQSRLQGASPGQLSLAGAEVGQLSLAQAEAGQLSLAANSAGQLSLPSAEPGQLSLGGPEKPASES